MCILFYFSFIRLYVCAFAMHFMVHCGSALRPGASELPYYCTPPVCVPAVLRGLVVWRYNNNKKGGGGIPLLHLLSLFLWVVALMMPV